MEHSLDIPPNWADLDLSIFQGLVMVLGAADVGKSTFARYLFRSLSTIGCRVAFLDGDPGQSALGPPTTLTLAFNLDAGDEPLPDIQVKRCFVGSTTPRGHMLPTVVGAARLAKAAREGGVDTLIYDTSGLVAPRQGGLALKGAKIDLLRPVALVAIQREQELEPLLVPYRRSRRTQVVDLRPSPGVIKRDPPTRRQHRARQFGRYFAQVHTLTVDWTRIAVFPLPLFRVNRLIALENNLGFTLALGIVTRIDRQAQQVTLLTPLSSLAGVDALRLGDLQLDPHTFMDERIH